MGTSSAAQRLKIEAHDASRVEWSMYLPLPAGKAVHEAEVDLLLEFPENAYVPHEGWDHLQVLARLSSPSSPDPVGVTEADPGDFDGLRREALAVARALKLLRESMPGTALAHSLNPMPVAPSLAKDLESILDRACGTLAVARAGLLAPRAADTPDLARERALADEFLSGQFLELVTEAEGICRRMEAAAGRHVAAYAAVAQKLEVRVREALAAELRHRERTGELLPDADDAEALALFLDRAARLKKHFHEVLFLEPEAKMVDQDFRNLVGLGGAAIAFVTYFALQALQTSAAAQASLGLGTIITVGAMAYALKDRMKELTRQWIAGKLSHLYANRVLVLREPARLDPGRNVVLRARESLLLDRVTRPDPLNPPAGAVQRVVTLRYRQRARVSALKGRSPHAFERIKLVFRYDLAPILTRLDDSVKRVPVPGGGPGEVRFAEVPRLYRVPLRLQVSTSAGIETRQLHIVLQRHGIVRIAPAESEAARVSLDGTLPGFSGLAEPEIADLDPGPAPHLST